MYRLGINRCLIFINGVLGVSIEDLNLEPSVKNINTIIARGTCNSKQERGSDYEKDLLCHPRP